LAKHFHPGIHVELEVMAGRDTEKEKWQDHRECRRHDDQEGPV
jgi:hypothetical protein